MESQNPIEVPSFSVAVIRDVVPNRWMCAEDLMLFQSHSATAHSVRQTQVAVIFVVFRRA